MTRLSENLALGSRRLKARREKAKLKIQQLEIRSGKSTVKKSEVGNYR